MSVLVETTIGDIVVDLFVEERPRATMNFLKLCKMKYYNYCLFFAVERNFIAQTGDPTGSGSGGSSIFEEIYGHQARYFEMEMKPRIKHTHKGLVSFANNKSNMHGSQFFITLGDNLDFLDGKHTVFGQVAEGMDVLNKLNETICDNDNRPYQDIRIHHTIVLFDPFDDPDGLKFPDRSPEPTKEQLKSDRIAADEELDADAGKSKEEIQEIIEEKDLRIGTQILETVGDIPDADLAPPENVLFVCKLNPVTTAEDLEIIFSRFGQICSCEIIHDQKTGDSLQYGFIEFEKVEDCEKAYFKMDNVLIDDRRIHVDFCQSVAKVKWKKSGLWQRLQNRNDGHKKQDIVLKKPQRNEKYEMVFANSPAEKNARKKPWRSEKNTDGKEKWKKRREMSSSDSSDDSLGSVSESSSTSSDEVHRRRLKKERKKQKRLDRRKDSKVIKKEKDFNRKHSSKTKARREISSSPERLVKRKKKHDRHKME